MAFLMSDLITQKAVTETVVLLMLTFVLYFKINMSVDINILYDEGNKTLTNKVELN